MGVQCYQPECGECLLYARRQGRVPAVFFHHQDDDGVAAVMGHEIAHAIAGHGNERVSQQLAIQTGLTSLDIALSEKPGETTNLILAAAGFGSQVVPAV